MSSQCLLWIVFGVVVLGMLALDLGVFHRRAHAIRIKEAMAWSAVWIAVSLLFNLGIFLWNGTDPALQFLTGYVIEKSLSIDNIFVFLMIFTYFRVPGQHQHRVLFWGILGALAMRGLFIGMGIVLIRRFHWVVYVFGGLLVLAGTKMLVQKDKPIEPEKNPILRLFRWLMPVAGDQESGRFFQLDRGRLCATPLFVVLLVVETTDVIFALDSIPAVLAISLDPFIVYSSNVFAILGLRALYFVLAGLMEMFCYLRYGLSAILVLVGLKMLLAGILKIPVIVALLVILGILLASVLASVAHPPDKQA